MNKDYLILKLSFRFLNLRAATALAWGMASEGSRFGPPTTSRGGSLTRVGLVWFESSLVSTGSFFGYEKPKVL